MMWDVSHTGSFRLGVIPEYFEFPGYNKSICVLQMIVVHFQTTHSVLMYTDLA
jgi:hypothetical protein